MCEITRVCGPPHTSMHALCWRLLRGHLPRIPQQLQSSDAAELTHCVALLRALHRQSNACALRWHEPLPRGVRSVSRAAAAPAADSEVRRQSRTANKREGVLAQTCAALHQL